MNIFVARLNFKTRREDLEAAFAKFGQVTSAKLLKIVTLADRKVLVL